MSRASESVLEALHNRIAETLTDELERYANGDYDTTDEAGVTIRKSIPASLIQSTIKYLKDNGIDRPEEEEPDPRDLLADDLPVFEEDDD